MRRQFIFLALIALVAVGLAAPASAKKSKTPPELGDYAVTLPVVGDGCLFQLTYDVIGKGAKTVEYDFTVTDSEWSDYPPGLTSAVNKKTNTNTTGFVIPATLEARVVTVEWTAELYFGNKKNPQLADTATGIESVTVDYAATDLCT